MSHQNFCPFSSEEQNAFQSTKKNHHFIEVHLHIDDLKANTHHAPQALIFMSREHLFQLFLTHFPLFFQSDEMVALVST